MSVKDSKDPAVLATYLDRYPNEEFGAIVRALITLYEQQRAAQAKSAQARTQREEARRQEELKRLEDDRYAREAADEEARAEERARREEAAKKKTEDIVVAALPPSVAGNFIWRGSTGASRGSEQTGAAQRVTSV